MGNEDVMKVTNLKKPTYQDLNRRDAEIIMLRAILAETYYLLKDRRSRGIDNAMFHIEAVCPEVKYYENT